MSLNDVPAGENLPDEVYCIIEIPAYSAPIKYEVDKDSGALFVDRFMATCMQYPLNYGYVNKTLSEDGDAVDVLVMTPHPLIAGSVIKVRPVGVLQMTDEAGQDAKIIAVPVDKLSKIYSNVHDIDDVPELTKNQIEHFFSHYKDLEKGKWVRIDGWAGIDAAKHEIVSSAARYQKSIS